MRSSSPLSRLARESVPSSTIALIELAADLQRQGRSVVSLVAGEPDDDTPDTVSQAGIAAITRGDTRYSAVAGTQTLREAIARKLRVENGLDYTAGQIVVSSGTKPLLYAALQAVVDPGQEVIVPAPYWVSYPELVRLAGARSVVVPTSPETGFKLTAQALSRALTAETRAVILNTPGNPSGAVYSVEELQALFAVLRAWPAVTVITDEIYEHLTYDGVDHAPPARCAQDLQDRVVIVHGFSKGYGMIGWRLGFAAGPAPIMKAISGFISHLVGAPNTISQAAAVAALDLPAGHFARIRDDYAVRRDFVLERMAALAGLAVSPPAGAFFVFVDVRGTYGTTTARGVLIDSDDAFCRALIEEAGLVVVPGTAFGSPGFFRLSYAVDRARIEAGMARLAGFIEGLRPQATPSDTTVRSTA